MIEEEKKKERQWRVCNYVCVCVRERERDERGREMEIETFQRLKSATTVLIR